ncbi:MAG: hypothetical protein ACI4NA_07375, partial [Succinivibrio sp.]
MGNKAFFWRMVASSLLRRRGSLASALLAIAVGATVLSGLAAISRDVPRQMGEEFRSYGANLIATARHDGERFTRGDLDSFIKAAGGVVAAAAPFCFEGVKVNEIPFAAAGTDFKLAKSVSPYWYVRGAMPDGDGGALMGRDAA